MNICPDCGLSSVGPDGCSTPFCSAKTHRPIAKEDRPRAAETIKLIVIDEMSPEAREKLYDDLSKADSLAQIEPANLSEPYRPSNAIMKYFEYGHLPEHLQKISKPFGDLATWMNDTLPTGPEKSAGLRKLLEAKDCAVRAALG